MDRYSSLNLVDLEYCANCGQPTIHNAYGAPLCNLCRDRMEEPVAEKKSTLVVNLIGGPGCGKSTVSAGVFFDLKMKGLDCELATEYAKDLTWSKGNFSLGNQVHVFGEQHHRIWRLLNQVEVVVTDSPLLLTPIYNPDTRDHLIDQLALSEFGKMWNYVVFLKRCKSYNPNGRNQTELEAIEIDRKILDFLEVNKIPYETTTGNLDGKNYIVGKVLLLLGKFSSPTKKEMSRKLEP